MECDKKERKRREWRKRRKEKRERERREKKKREREERNGRNRKRIDFFPKSSLAVMSKKIGVRQKNGAHEMLEWQYRFR